MSRFISIMDAVAFVFGWEPEDWRTVAVCEGVFDGWDDADADRLVDNLTECGARAYDNIDDMAETEGVTFSFRTGEWITNDVFDPKPACITVFHDASYGVLVWNN